MFKRKKKDEAGTAAAGPAGQQAEGPASPPAPGPAPGAPEGTAHEGSAPEPSNPEVAMAASGPDPRPDAAVTGGPVPEGAAAVAAEAPSAVPEAPRPEAYPAALSTAVPDPNVAMAGIGPLPEHQEQGRSPVSFYVGGIFDDPRPPSRESLQRQAEEDFQRAISPSLQPLRELVPDASSPDEAMRALAERQGEFVPDPDGDVARGGDIYRTDATVYYRIRTHFDKPSRRVGLARRQPWRPPPGLARPRD